MLRFKIEKDSKVPVFLQIKQQLKEYITEEGFPTDAPLPHVGKIAEAAGVCVRTADQALLALIEEGLCYRKPKRGTFLSCGAARPKLKTVGISSPYQLGDFGGHHVENAIYVGIIEAGRKMGVQVSFMPSAMAEILRFYKNSQENELIGVMLISGVPGSADLNMFTRMEPTRFCILNYDGFADCVQLPDNVFCVFNDDFLGGYLAGEHLIAQGCRKPAVLTFNIDNNNYTRRVDGFLQALRDYGLEFDPRLLNCAPSATDGCGPNVLVESGSALLTESKAEWIEYENLRAQIGLGGQLTDHIYNSQVQFDSVFCVNDYLAFGASRRCQSSGCKVIGYDNIHPDLAKTGGFATVSVDFHRMGTVALQMMLDKINEKEKQIIRIKPQVIPSRKHNTEREYV